MGLSFLSCQRPRRYDAPGTTNSAHMAICIQLALKSCLKPDINRPSPPQTMMPPSSARGKRRCCTSSLVHQSITPYPAHIATRNRSWLSTSAVVDRGAMGSSDSLLIMPIPRQTSREPVAMANIEHAFSVLGRSRNVPCRFGGMFHM